MIEEISFCKNKTSKHMPVAEEYVPDMHMLHTDELEAPLKMQDSEKHFRHYGRF